MSAGRRRGARAGRATAASLTLLALAACASTPDPAPAPPPTPVAPESPALEMLAPRAASGTWRLRTAIERSRRRGPASSTLALYTSVSRSRQMDGPDTTFNAAVSIPGYTSAPRGRSTTPAAWWPVPGDSLVVQVSVQRGDHVQLRGRMEGRTISGELWYQSLETGNSFQLGTFTAVRR